MLQITHRPFWCLARLRLRRLALRDTEALEDEARLMATGTGKGLEEFDQIVGFQWDMLRVSKLVDGIATPMKNIEK